MSKLYELEISNENINELLDIWTCRGIVPLL
jgi:hypothetical protein